MQGKLSEIDIRSILQLVELGQRTGELFVEAYGATGYRTAQPSPSSWLVFFVNGRIVYAGDSGGDLMRVHDYLRRYRQQPISDLFGKSTIATLNTPEYGYLWILLENHLITPVQARSVVQGMVRETLFDLLSLHQGSFIFEMSPALAPQLTTLEIAPLVTRMMKQVQEWKQFYPHLSSPDHCPSMADPDQLREMLTETSFGLLERWVDGKTSLRQMARYLNRDIVTVARAIYPYVQQGLVHLTSPITASPLPQTTLPPAEPFLDKVPRIVCIDDGATVRKTVEDILNRSGYEVTAIANPLKALSLLFYLKPDLILCDIAMPELDGYELCAMLRSASAFRETPIVMLTGKEGFIDRVRARIVGATDYLTKPFDEGELLMLVEKYVGVGNPDRPQPDTLLAEDLEAELAVDYSSLGSASRNR
ncbi:response regulator [Leptolyngbya ohadii]|uniref:response regulator n=1 Tax=Leptolyngbya ohadii TaxID=1962290 RepID=UPI000B59BC0F|nr:response regulator [Leptolyngbya ohadii]